MLPFLAPLALKLSPVGRFLKAIPWQLWLVVALVVAVGVGSCVHRGKVKAFGEERYAAGVKAEGERIAQKAIKLANEAAEISAKARSLNNETNRRISADADTLRVSGPGKAACFNPATPGAGRRVAPAGKPDAARSEMPPADRDPMLVAAVPWPWLVGRAEQCDLNRAEAETWRTWHKQLEEVWKKDADR